MLGRRTFEYGRNGRNGSAIWFDAETYGQDKLVTHYTLRDWTPGQSLDCIDEFPISPEARRQLKSLYTDRRNVLEGKSESEAEDYLSGISYPDFLRKHAGVNEEVIQLFDTVGHGSWGVETRALSASEGLWDGFPGLNLIGLPPADEGFDYPVAMFPDGNASLARLP